MRVSGTVRPGETVDIGIDQTAPQNPGNYKGQWQIVNSDRAAFGNRIWVKITIPGPPPTQTPVPQPSAVPPIPVQPTLAPPPAITVDYFNVAPSNTISAGDVATINWSFSGQGLAFARLTRTNPDGTQTPLYGGADVDLQGSYDDFLPDPGTYTYSLSIGTEFAGTVVKTITVTVNKKSK